MTGPGSPCAWCRKPIPAGRRRDTVTCSKPCRQARARFLSTVGTGTPVADGQPRRLAYADPPYPGLSKRYYGNHRDYRGEVDHAELIASLSAEYDAWALSTSARALPMVLRLCPDDTRVAAWVRGGRHNKAARGPQASWEPVLYWGAVDRPPAVWEDLHDTSHGTGTERHLSSVDARQDDIRWDSLVAGVTVRSTDPERVVGAKPAKFARWVFRLLDARPGDELVDVFPGSGGIARAWAHYAGPVAATGDDDTCRADLVDSTPTDLRLADIPRAH